MTTGTDESKEKEAKDAFKARASLLPSRKVDIPEQRRGRSMNEAESDIGEATDLQASLKRLFPKFSIQAINTAASAVMVGRVLPETMLDRIHLTVTAIVEDWDEEKGGACPIMQIINMVTTAFEIGVDSKGRLDVVELHNATSNEDLEKLANKIND